MVTVLVEFYFAIILMYLTVLVHILDSLYRKVAHSWTSVTNKFGKGRSLQEVHSVSW